MAVIVDSSVWIELFAGRTVVAIESAMSDGEIVMSPIVVAELLSGAPSPRDREAIGDLLLEFRLHATPLGHWMEVGELRRELAQKGINVTIPDAHVAQCALDLRATLYSGDEIFQQIAKHTRLRCARA